MYFYRRNIANQPQKSFASEIFFKKKKISIQLEAANQFGNVSGLKTSHNFCNSEYFRDKPYKARLYAP